MRAALLEGEVIRSPGQSILDNYLGRLGLPTEGSGDAHNLQRKGEKAWQPRAGDLEVLTEKQTTQNNPENIPQVAQLRVLLSYIGAPGLTAEGGVEMWLLCLAALAAHAADKTAACITNPA